MLSTIVCSGEIPAAGVPGLRADSLTFRDTGLRRIGLSSGTCAFLVGGLGLRREAMLSETIGLSRTRVRASFEQVSQEANKMPTIDYILNFRVSNFPNVPQVSKAYKLTLVWVLLVAVLVFRVAADVRPTFFPLERRGIESELQETSSNC